MKRTIITSLLLLVILATMVGCGSSEPEHQLSYIKSERITLFDEYDCIAVFTQYTNGSSESAIPADNLDVKAYQNGVELPPLVPTGEKTEGYIQCDASVQSGTTANVVWIFQLDDESTVSIEMPDGETKEVDLTQN